MKNPRTLYKRERFSFNPISFPRKRNGVEPQRKGARGRGSNFSFRRAVSEPGQSSRRHAPDWSETKVPAADETRLQLVRRGGSRTTTSPAVWEESSLFRFPPISAIGAGDAVCTDEEPPVGQVENPADVRLSLGLPRFFHLKEMG